MSIANTLRQIQKTEILTYKKTSGFSKENVKNICNTINLTDYSKEMIYYKFDSQTHLKERSLLILKLTISNPAILQ